MKFTAEAEIFTENTPQAITAEQLMPSNFSIRKPTQLFVLLPLQFFS